jgi:NitT/TauT family transport system ATP-binding protein
MSHHGGEVGMARRTRKGCMPNQQDCEEGGRMKDTSTQANPVIEARGLNLVFQTSDGPVHALKDVDLTIAKGDFVSFIGPSGCGKTTFLRCVAALEHPTGGTLTVNGMTPDEARRRRRAYGYVFQAAGLYPWRTIAGNIRLPLEIMGFSREEQAARRARVLDLVELSGFGNKFPWQLSGGMQQRASIARALAFDADILLMDEPFGALDEIVRDRLNEELAEALGRHGQDHRLCHPFDPRGGLSVHQDRGDEPAPRPDHRRDRQPPAARAPLGHPRQPRIHRDRPPRARGASGGAWRRCLGRCLS